MRFRLRSPFAYRRLVRSLDRIGEALEVQTVLLARLVERLAPAVTAEAPADESVSFVDEGEMITSLAFIERTRQRTGHTPSDEEVIAYLAEEKTQALQSRLNDRSDLLERLR